MYKIIRARSVGIVVGLLAANARVGRAQAQSTRSLTGYTPVVIAVTRQFPYRNAQAVIVRRVSAADHDVILVRATGLQAPRLAAAVGALQAVRARFGDTPSHDMVIRVQDDKPRGRIAEARKWVELLVRTPVNRVRPVPGLEESQYIRIFLPNHPGSSIN